MKSQYKSGTMKDREALCQHIVVPERGWRPSSWYLINVALSVHNVIHPALLYTGLLNDNGEPKGYDLIVSTNGSCEFTYRYRDAVWLTPVKFLFTGTELRDKSGVTPSTPMSAYQDELKNRIKEGGDNRWKNRTT